jgi:hypothetical protein
LQLEYGFDVFAELQRISLHEQSHSAEYKKQWHLEQKEKSRLLAEEDAARIAANWPSVLPDDIVQSCVNDYYLGSQWKKLQHVPAVIIADMLLKCLQMK